MEGNQKRCPECQERLVRGEDGVLYCPHCGWCDEPPPAVLGVHVSDEAVARDRTHG